MQPPHLIKSPSPGGGFRCIFLPSCFILLVLLLRRQARSELKAVPPLARLNSMGPSPVTLSRLAHKKLEIFLTRQAVFGVLAIFPPRLFEAHIQRTVTSLLVGFSLSICIKKAYAIDNLHSIYPLLQPRHFFHSVVQVCERRERETERERDVDKCSQTTRARSLRIVCLAFSLTDIPRQPAFSTSCPRLRV